MKKTVFAIGLGLALTVPAAFATSVNLNPSSGTSTLSDNGTLPCNASTCAAVANFSFTNLANPTESVSGTEYVYKTGGGTYDFFYQIKNTGTSDAYNTLNVDFFQGYTTAVAYDTNGCTAGAANCITPSGNGGNLASRDNTGNAVNFFFSSPTDGTIMPGDTTAWVEVDTNATSFTTGGLVGVIDSGGFNSFPDAIYQPASAPEPASLALLGGGLALLGLGRLRKSKKA